jgi:hypothetical protein
VHLFFNICVISAAGSSHAAAPDIFCAAPDGHLVWRSAAEGFETAQRRVRILMAIEPADYVIYSQETGRKPSFMRTIPNDQHSPSAH